MTYPGNTSTCSIKTNQIRNVVISRTYHSHKLTMAKKKVEKKKGPKGKKARAAAKLDRQWGEHVDEKAPTSYRRGKSRLLSKNTPTGRMSEDSDEEEIPMKDADNKDIGNDYSDDEPEGDALHCLLKSINKKSKRSDMDLVNPQDDALIEEGTDDESVIENSQEADTEESDIDEQTIEKINNDHADHTQSIDPFSNHFNQQPLTENDEEISQLMSSRQLFDKIPTLPLDKSLDLQLSAPSVLGLLKSHNILDPQGSLSKAKLAWYQVASNVFSCNRKILKVGWKIINKQVIKVDSDGHGTFHGATLSSLQSCLYPPLASYADILLTMESRKNQDAINNVLHLHLLNHVLTARGRIQRNNKRIKELEDEDDDRADKYRDQGYTRPSVLILLPTRGSCHSIFNSMMSLLGNPQVESIDRFEEEYGPAAIEDDPNEDPAVKQRRKFVQGAKGKNWNELFGDDVNADDDFKVGFSMTPKVVGGKGEGGSVAVKMYTNFYRSDIIMASPLALKMAIESDNDDDEASDSDFLSSIEICVVAQAEVIYMQNWDHVQTVLDHLNRQPKKNNGTDFGRVRQYLLAGQAKHWRQTIFTSTFSDPMILSTFKRHSTNMQGAMRLRRRVHVEEASLNNIMVRSRQVFQRVPCSSFANQGDERMKYFEERVLPQMLRSKQKHTMIFIPSYFDFVSVRNLLLKKEVDFVSVTEYARVSEVTRGRARFLQGRKPLMLYTGRAHYFSRHAIKGVRHLIFFGLPEISKFYTGLVNELNKGLDRNIDSDMDTPTSVLALYTKYEAHSLERIVGKQHCDRMVKGEKQTFMFVS